METRQNVSFRQREEWDRFRTEIIEPLFLRVTGGDEKNAKGLADILKIAQEGERKAWGFDDSAEACDNNLTVCFKE